MSNDLTLVSINLCYANTKVLKDLDLAVKAGSIVGILGASGSGKTSLLRAVAGFEKPVSGAIKVGEKEVFSSNINLPCIERGVGFVFQDLALFPHMTVEQNLLYGADTAKKKDLAKEFADNFGLTKYFKKFPGDISGGERQRLALARSLCLSPKVLLLDEPFTGMDQRLLNQLLPEIRNSLKKIGVTVLLVSHNLDHLSQMADSLCVLEGGRVVQQGMFSAIYQEPINKHVAELMGHCYWVPVEKGSSEFGEFKYPVYADQGLVRKEDFLVDDSSGVECQVTSQCFIQGHYEISLLTPKGLSLVAKTHKSYESKILKIALKNPSNNNT